MGYEPSHMETLLTRFAFIFCGRSVYKTFSDHLPLNGSEQVLDFGYGMGTVAYYVAKRLSHGKLTCLDISARWLKACRRTLRNCENIQFFKWESRVLPHESYDVAYCHFALHDIPDSDLESIIPALARSLKPGGVLVFREPLNEAEKIGLIKRLMEHNGLLLKDSRVTDIPLMGNALESVYIRR